MDRAFETPEQFNDYVGGAIAAAALPKRVTWQKTTQEPWKYWAYLAVEPAYVCIITIEGAEWKLQSCPCRPGLTTWNGADLPEVLEKLRQELDV